MTETINTQTIQIEGGGLSPTPEDLAAAEKQAKPETKQVKKAPEDK